MLMTACFGVAVLSVSSCKSQESAQAPAKVSITTDETDHFFINPDVNPSFGGGENSLKKFIAKNLRYPKKAEDNGVEGRAVVQFVVNADGSITDAVEINGCDADLAAEAIRVVESMPDWNPAQKDGQAVRSIYNLPFNFKLGKSSDAVYVASAPKSSAKGPSVFFNPDVVASYIGGDEALMKFINSNLRYPKKAIKNNTQGRAVVQFIVNENGSISEAVEINGCDAELAAEAVRVVKSMPTWTPAQKDGKDVASIINFPINFRLSDSSEAAPAPAPVAASAVAEDGPVVTNPDENASYIGGDDALMNFFNANIKYPKNAQKNGIEGQVIIQFVVNTNGSISDAKIINKCDPDLGEEALRIVKSMPAWNPAKKDGKIVRSLFNIPIRFRLG